MATLGASIAARLKLPQPQHFMGEKDVRLPGLQESERPDAEGAEDHQ
tara:strand:+ start:1051 stop:1191 length:141 start_codon:yes stop_codon:yes gene_type:complete